MRDRPNSLQEKKLRRFATVVLVVGGVGILWLWAGGPPEAPIPEGPLRILSLSPNVTEILFRLGLGDEVVGVTDFCRYPPEAREKVHVGGLLNPNLERMIALEPTLAIVLPAQRDLSKKLASRGIGSLVVSNDSVDEVLQSIATIGGVTGRRERAASLADSIRGVIGKARSARLAKRWRTMVVVERTSSKLKDLFVVGPGTYLDEVITMVGAENVFGRSLARYPEVSAEEVLYRNPEVIIELKPEGTDREREEKLARSAWRRLSGLAAADEGRIYVLAGDHLLVPGPRIGKTIEEFSNLLAEVR